MGRLEGAVALVTGAASPNGIGFATAKRLVREGAKVVLTDVVEDAVAARAGELGENAIAMGQDVGSEASWDAIVSRAVAHFGQLDILINNAGIAAAAEISVSALEDWDRQIRVNLTGVYLGCRAAIRQMRARGAGGAIVNLSSVAGLVGVPNAAAYSASKAGVRLLTKTVALDGSAYGIRCNSVHPGIIATDMTAALDKEQMKSLTAPIPLGRLGAPDEIAAMILFLVCDDANYITGAEFVVDGGFTAQ